MKNDIHYDTSLLTLDQKRDFLNRAYEKNSGWWVDKLDCKVSWARQKIEKSFKEIMTHLTESCHFTITHRRQFREQDYLEVCFNTMNPGRPDYFLWIIVPIELVGEFTKDLKCLKC